MTLLDHGPCSRIQVKWSCTSPSKNRLDHLKNHGKMGKTSQDPTNTRSVRLWHVSVNHQFLNRSKLVFACREAHALGVEERSRN